MSGFTKSIVKEDYLDAAGKKKMDSRRNKKPRCFDKISKSERNVRRSLLRAAKIKAKRNKPEKVSVTTNLS